MSRIKETRWIAGGVLVWLCLANVAPVIAADLIVLKDGSEYEGMVIELDRRRLIFEHDDGERETFPFSSLERIEFGEEESPPLHARVRVHGADDEVVIFVDGTAVASAAELRAGWIDISPLLATGTSEVRAEVVNRNGPWAYRWTLEAGTQKKTFACGLVGKSGCRKDGGTGREKGTFSAGRALLFVHRSSAEAEIQVEEE